MNFIKRAFWNMKAKKGKTLLQLFVFTVICVFVLSGLTIQSAAQKSSELARQELGGSVTLQVDRQKQMEKQQDSGEKRSFESTPIKVSDANKLAALDHVKSYNYITSASANAGNFDAIESSSSSSSDSSSSSNTKNGQGGPQRIQADLSIEGVTSTALVDEFSDGDSKITDGRAITKSDVGKNVTVINETLAVENDVSVGDSITIESATDEDTTVKLKVVGIYKTTSSGDDQAQNFSFLNPYNKLYTPYTATAALKGDDYKNTIDSAVYYMDDAKNMDAFVKAAKKTSIDFNTYTLNTNDQLYQQMVGPIENVASFSKNVVYLVSVAGAVILGLIVMMSIRERKYEMGVLMAIGEKRWKLIGQFLTEILIVAVIAIGLASVTGNLVANQLGNQLLSQQISSSSDSTQTASGQNGQMPSGGGGMGGGMFGHNSANVDVIDSLNVAVSMNDMLVLGGIGIIIAIIATLLPSISVLRLHPKTILTKQE
ncbi:ABC transporter permease [Bacillus spizizenii ATCC 6633 = JCM 2499]|uniref:Putative transporter n=1 Tax=Bacillus spizizenii (strain ATCC 23059 / NRRL B-14472 / W23) TaxID=655816 RepID=E0U2E6_BACSH|nr:ABC transporter permease [Bacillus spizizenii]QCJ15770.1 ABC transporter permease [Bacillus subtilis]ADM36444.1 putative transporter [Bacillus spizizenii str. W23]AJW85895.1 macrolide ABC transporter permease [Bacillus spizizenii]EFG90905.1 putative transporter [Bacillus spizizenii ATCC 6633 = JCM 2499]KFK77302.1 ftsX-like permease family protein [Bacillus spizizenii]